MSTGNEHSPSLTSCVFVQFIFLATFFLDLWFCAFVTVSSSLLHKGTLLESDKKVHAVLLSVFALAAFAIFEDFCSPLSVALEIIIAMNKAGCSVR